MAITRSAITLAHLLLLIGATPRQDALQVCILATQVLDSVECWNAAGELVGGLYGVSLGGAFFGESMFSRATDASKIALVHLVARLKTGGYGLLDAQFHNPHLEQFGLEEISRDEFRDRLWRALRLDGDFYSLDKSGLSTAGSTSLQAITQIS